MTRTVLVSTQTPLLRFDGDQPGPAGDHLPPHRLSPGGVCRMELPTLQRFRKSGWMRKAHWYSLQPGAPATVEIEDGSIELHHLEMTPEQLRSYGRSKERLWAQIHGLPSQPFSVEDFRHYVQYNSRTAHALLEHADELDVAYIHDFQLLQVGSMIGLAAPTVLRWHVPFDPARIPGYTRQFMLRVMEDFDAVIVSTRRDLQGFMDAGFRGRVRQLYPHIDENDWPDASAADVARLEERWKLRPDDPMYLLVARMDPMKRQDLAVRAFARVHAKNPRARLVLVGNGSFSGPMGGVTGKGKSQEWRAKLEALVAELRLQDHVTFAHWIPDDLLAAAYARSTAVLLTSDIEGFGLTPLEAWRYGRVPIISRGTGAAEVIVDGINGLLFDVGDDASLAAAMERVLRDRSLAERVGEAGRLTLPNHTASAMNPHIRRILEEAIDTYGA